MSTSTAFRIVPAGDSTLLVQFENRIDPVVNARAIGLAHAIEAAAIAGVRDIVPTYRSVAVFFDPLRTQVDGLVREIEREAGRPAEVASDPPTPLRVPVCYESDCGPDLGDVARFAGMSTDEVVAIHTGATYRVFMLGFFPGFAYMGVVDDRIAAPRHSTPRVRVPKGSVGIAGRQTGIYPSDAPGGWQLIGRTPIEPFNLARSSPFLFKAGDSVQFVSVDRAEFERLVRVPPSRSARHEPRRGEAKVGGPDTADAR
jgi:inhibitor of KinA